MIDGDGGRGSHKIAAYAQFVEPGVGSAYSQGESEDGMNDSYDVEVALAGVDGGEGHSGEKGDQGKTGVGQMRHRKNRSGENQGAGAGDQGAQHAQTEALQHELLHEGPADI